MIRTLLLSTLVAGGLVFAGLTETAQADHKRQRHGGFHGGYGRYCPDYGIGYGRGFRRSPFYGGSGFNRGFYQPPPHYGHRPYGFGGSGLYIQGRNFGLGFSRW